MMKTEKEIVIDGTTYVPKGSITTLPNTKTLKGLKYVLVRGDKSGIFVGYLKSRKEKEVTLLEARRLWFWSGASSISQIAVDGVSKPNDCKFPTSITELLILDAIEVLPCTEKARQSIANVPIWRT